MADEERLQSESAEASVDDHAADDSSESQAGDGGMRLESGTYEIIRGRLVSHGQDLRKRLGTLNSKRKDAFGSIETALLGTERITTEHNCVPRDMVSVGHQLIFGYNVTFGLKSEIGVQDVFSAYTFADGKLAPAPLDLVSDNRFRKDFEDVYKYYKHATFARFFRTGVHLFMVFQVGASVNDIKSFKWAITDDGLVYIDNRSDHEVVFPPQHGFDWTLATRDMHQSGAHPHISIDDRVFVETVGGDLTVKVENNTASGAGIYSEPVNHADQTLDDARIEFSVLGNIILMKVRPYQENTDRYLVFNEKVQQVVRLDAIEHACVQLPDDHGLIFSNGYYLQTGENKTFESDLQDMQFATRIDSQNGEDFLYVFHNRDTGVYILLNYNLIEQKVDTPLVCHGFSLFEAGELVCFRSQDTAAKHHAIQVWQTPYTGTGFEPPGQQDSFLHKVGNKDIVRGMAECHEVLGLINKEDTYANLYVDIVKQATDILDSFFWITNEDTGGLATPLAEIRNAAASAIDEFEKVVRVKRNTAGETTRVEGETRTIIADVGRRRFETIEDFVDSLAALRRIRGDIITLRDLRYIDNTLVEQLEGEVVEQNESLSHRCVEFLLRPASLAPYENKVAAELANIEGLKKGSDAKTLEQAIDQSAADLEMLIDIVSNLDIDDATQRTAIIDNISDIFSTVNQARAGLKKKSRDLMSVEGVAEFNSQLKLLDQSIVNYLDVCDSPEKCDEFLTKVMIGIEELEGRFAEFDEFVVQLSEKRDEVYNAFETRKLQLVEARNKRATALMAAAERILGGIQSRVGALETVNDINGYFAADLMIDKVRDLVDQLKELDDNVKVDDIQSRLKTIREDAVRQLKDRQDLFVDGENVIRLGNHHFSVNVQTLDLTTVFRNGKMALHLTGTDFFETIGDDDFLATSELWDQDIVSETTDVYRGEYLAHRIFTSLDTDDWSNGPSQDELLAMDPESRLAVVQQFMGPRYAEGYVKGVHDRDAAQILFSLLQMNSRIGLLRYHAKARALATHFWNRFGHKQDKTRIAAQLTGFGNVNQAFPGTSAQQAYIANLTGMLDQFVSSERLFDSNLVDEAAGYLFAELTQPATRFVVSRTAAEYHESFANHLKSSGHNDRFANSLAAVKKDAAGALHVARDWVEAFLESRDEDEADDYIDEVAHLLLEGSVHKQAVVDASAVTEIDGLAGDHRVIDGSHYHLHYNRFMQKLDRFQNDRVPRFLAYQAQKKELVETARDSMRLDEFRPRVLTSFVRSKLIDQVYLPVVGDNLAKQMGVVGEEKRTDLMGLLLLVSPPGYGKTTLMEYIANRLGIIFMKINGPAIGHHVTSLDPSEAPNAAAREEVEKLNLALEMGDNVMIYLDDIQHTNPEFLQKFISLCDAQRKIEGVYKGRTRTYDLRGRKVCVVMAGNPYTESGEKFQIPDMLTNRADIYNLGEMIGDSGEAFEMSYLENCLTSNSALNPLATRSQNDVYAVIRMASGDTPDGIELEGNYSPEELAEFVDVMKKLMTVRDVILAVNREYIRSAATADDYRTEPAFKLQGSYRNMNRIAEKVVPIMNDQELQSLIVSNYENDAQTLTSDTEANLLKFKELIGQLDEQELERWNDIKKTFQRNVKMRGVGADDRVGQVVVQLSSFSEGLDAIRDAMADGLEQLATTNTLTPELDPDSADDNTPIQPDIANHVAGLRESLDAIRDALADAAARPVAIAVPEPAVPEPAVPEDDAKSQDDAPRVEIVEPDDPEDEDGEEELDRIGTANTITVVNKIPPSLLKVLRQQFQLMEGWMEPLLKSSQAQQGELKQLREQIETTLDDYERLIGQVRSSKSKRSRARRSDKQ
ncbi:MAG: DNA repair ATPase [Planctomycetaceae bacterium]